MTTLEELKKERDRFARIVEIKKRHLKQCKKVLIFYAKQVKKIEAKIRKLQCRKNTKAEAADAKAQESQKDIEKNSLLKQEKSV